MGLDNGIQVRRNSYTNNIEELKAFEEIWDKDHKWDFEICYWRKCWNIRNDILWVLNSRFDDQYEFELTSEDIGNIIIILMSYNEDSWTDGGGSIWSFEEMKEHLQQDVENLKLLQELMEKYNLEVYFYDSY